MAKQFKERVAKVTIPNFNYEVVIVISTDVFQSAAKRGMDTEKNWYAMHAGATNAMLSYIFLPFNPRPGSVAHECSHCVWHLMSVIGAELENEVVAYNISYLVDSIYHVLKPPKRKAKKVKAKAKVKTATA